MTDQAKPTVTYWHLWADADGVSHQKSCRMTEFEMPAPESPCIFR